MAYLHFITHSIETDIFLQRIYQLLMEFQRVHVKGMGIRRREDIKIYPKRISLANDVYRLLREICPISLLHCIIHLIRMD